MKRIAALLLLLVAACASPRPKTDDGSADIFPPPVVAQPAATDARLVELQTSMTELLERIDVLNDRIARLETVAGGSEQRAMAAPSNALPPPSLATSTRTTMAQAVAPSRSREPEMPVSPSAASKPLMGARIADSYRHALELYGKSRMAEARQAFQSVFDADPAGELADNALYWIGETYFTQGNYPEAMRFYTRVTKEYSNENKAPDAFYKMGVTFEKTGDLALARQSLEECIKRYPYSTPAAAAKRELKRIKY